MRWLNYFDLSVGYVRINLTEWERTVEDAGPYSVEKFVHIFLAVRRWKALTIIIYLVGTGVLDGPNTNDFNQSNDITISPINRNF